MNYLLTRGVLAVALLMGISFFILGHPQAKAQDQAFNNIPPPDEKGPYNVGVRTFADVPVSGGGTLSLIHVSYPTDPTLVPPNCQTKFTIVDTGGTYQLSSPLCAAPNAPIAPGTFPLIIHDHGGGTVGSADAMITRVPVHETWASHGFVVVAIRHSPNAAPPAAPGSRRVRDIPFVID